MKKIFTLIVMAVMALGAQAETDPVVYTFDNLGSTYVLGDNCEASTYTMDGKEGFSVNYTNAGEKMQVKLAANEDIFFEYKNSSTKNNAMKTGENYAQFDAKNYIIMIPVKTGDVVYVKFSAKGSNAPILGIDGSEPPITANDGAATTCSGKTEADAVVFSATATKGGTAKIKESASGMRLYAIGINKNPNETTAIQTVKAAQANDGAVYNLAGQKVGNDFKGIVIKDGKKMLQK